MRALLDTHALYWWVTDHPQLSLVARRIIADPANEVLISAAVTWELATKTRLGKWPGAASLAGDFEAIVAAQGFVALPITLAHARHAGLLVTPHRDPFDRMLAAQATLEGAVLLSAAPAFAAFDVTIAW